MMVLCLFVTFIACIIGKICGMGGGVIIKPVLDALHIASPSDINFLSGCTVIGMSGWSVMKSVRKETAAIDFKVSTPLAFGAAIGGIAGKSLYSMLETLFTNSEHAGGVQAVLLLLATIGTFVYTINKAKIISCKITNTIICIIIGLGLGLLGSFLGIGGGPFNMAVLYFFFSMDTKTAAQNSLYIILISQISGLIKNIITENLPEVALLLLIAMVFCGIAGSEMGSRLNQWLDDKKTTILFEGSMVLVMIICIYNIYYYF